MSGTLYDVAVAAACRWGDREFLVVGPRREVLRFADLAKEADRFGHLLASRGVRPGDRVALAMANSTSWAVAAFGIARAGAVIVALSTRLTAREAMHLIDLTTPSLVVMDDEVRGRRLADEWLGPLRAWGDPVIIVRSRDGKHYPGTLDWTDEVRVIGSSLPPAADLVAMGGAFAGVAAVLSTSGTTAAPKGVMLTHRGLIRLAKAVAARQDLGPQERFMTIAPFFHCSGFMHGLLTCLVSGTTMFATARYDPDEFWDTLVREGVTAYHGFIGPLRDLAADERRDLRAARQFDRAWYSAPATEMAELERAWGVRMCEVYGLTETGGNVSICRADDPVEMRHDSDGRPHEGVEVRVVDPSTGRALPDGEPGELWVRGWNVMRGYIGDPQATGQALDSEGWLHTGDQGVRLRDGYIKFISRLKDIIRVGGENVSPMEIEEVILGHPRVAEVAVVSAPDPRLGEVPVAFVVLRSNQAVTDGDLKTYCRQRLADFKVPRRFLFVDDLPRTGATHRVQKAKLREMLRSSVAP